jgi:predicted MFS family arabinose efflux permease
VTLTTNERTLAVERERLPLTGLLALFTAGFLGILNETVPAGLLPKMSKNLGLSQSVVGQTITVYAVATALTAIPLNAAFKNVGRRKLITSALLTFVVANAAIALLNNFALIMIARTVAGIGAGLIWSNIGGYAARIVPERHQGKAITIAMAGIPAALAFGLPAGTLLGDAAGWHATFGVMAAVGVVLIAWMLAALPELPGQPEGGHVPMATVLRRPGVRAIIAILVGYMVAHNLAYTYVGPLTDHAGVGGQIQWVLLTFGLAALLSIWATGTYIDPHHRRLMITSTIIVGASFVILGFAVTSPAALYLGAAAWGLGFGGSATLILTAGIRAAGTDGVQSVIVTAFNASIAIGGALGGLLLSGFGVESIPWVAVAIMIPTALATLAGRRHAFPDWPRGKSSSDQSTDACGSTG